LGAKNNNSLGEKADGCILISAGAEWRTLNHHYPQAEIDHTPYGEYFKIAIKGQELCFIHGGWGKVAAAGSTQYAIDRWQPDWVINIGTCGGFSGQIIRGEIILARKTIIYDIIEQMTNLHQAINHYTTEIDLSWLPETLPQSVTIGTLVSADRDILPEDIPELINHYHAAVADWESGAIAWIAKKNNLPCLILRGVTDLVDASTGEAYGDYAFFEQQSQSVMFEMIQYLPFWIEIMANSGGQRIGDPSETTHLLH